MAKAEHNVTLEMNPRSSPGFRQEANCTCAWSAKVDTLDEAKQVADRHIKANGGLGKVTEAMTQVAEKSVEVGKFYSPPASLNPTKGTESKPATPVGTK